MKLPFGTVEPLRKSIGLGAEVALREFMIRVSLEFHDAAVVDMGDDSAAVGTIQRARRVNFLRAQSKLPSLNSEDYRSGRRHARRPDLLLLYPKI